MRSSILLLAAASSAVLAQDKPAEELTTGKQGDAPYVTDSPAGRAVIARFAASDKSAIAGSVLATSGPNGLGTAFTVNINGLDKAKGPYSYHIHAVKVAEDGNCDSTKAHLDPFERGQKPGCDAARPQTCEIGDLSGKWGKMTDEAFSASYVDPFVSLNGENKAYAAELSVVIHNGDGDRVACTNFADLLALLDECDAKQAEKPAEPKPEDKNETPNEPGNADDDNQKPNEPGSPTDKNETPGEPSETPKESESESSTTSESTDGPTGTDDSSDPSATDPTGADAPDSECGVPGPNGEPAVVCDEGISSSLAGSVAAVFVGLAVALFA